MTIGRIVKIPVRITFYRRSSIAFKNNFFRELYSFFTNRLVLYFSSKIFSNSKLAFQYFFSSNDYSKNVFKIIDNGVDSRVFKKMSYKDTLKEKYGMPLDKTIVGHVGRYDSAKNHITILNVAKKLKGNYQFVFCGSETDSLELKEKCVELGISDHVLSLGTQELLPEIYNAFDIFYFPSITEGQPNALIEAVMCKVPILASNIDPIKEIFEKKYHKFLIDPLDMDVALQKLKMNEFLVLNEVDFSVFLSRFDSKNQFSKFEAEIHE